MHDRKKVGKAKLKRAMVVNRALKSEGVLPAMRLWTTALEPTMLCGASVAGISRLNPRARKGKPPDDSVKINETDMMEGELDDV